MIPGSIRITVDDDTTAVEMIGGASWTLPVGPTTLVAEQLERADRPAPEQLTNALGIVIDHLDDCIRDTPMLLSAPSVTFAGHHVEVLARVELGTDEVPVGYAIERVDADDVFRTLVAEPVAERLHNPGLPAADVETVVATCCVVLAVMRRLELTSAAIVASADGSETS